MDFHLSIAKLLIFIEKALLKHRFAHNLSKFFLKMAVV